MKITGNRVNEALTFEGTNEELDKLLLAIKKAKENPGHQGSYFGSGAMPNVHFVSVGKRRFEFEGEIWIRDWPEGPELFIGGESPSSAVQECLKSKHTVAGDHYGYEGVWRLTLERID